MVEEIRAFRASDGSIHATRREAGIADATLRLTETKAFNEMNVNAIIQHARVVYDALAPLVADEVVASPDRQY